MIDIPNDIAELLKSSVKKNVRISFPNGEHEDITNTQLVTESLEFTESLCSQSELKFGLCEASSLKFECFGIPNIKGKTIDVDIDIKVSPTFDELGLDTSKHRTWKFKNEDVKNICEFTIYSSSSKVTCQISQSGTGGSIMDEEEITITNGIGKFNVTVPKKNYDYDTYEYTFLTSDRVTIEYMPQYLIIDGINYYPIKLGRFVVDNCKRDSTNMQKRQVEAYSEVATMDWDFPKSLKALYNYSWSAKQTIQISFYDLIDLISPEYMYNRIDYKYTENETVIGDYVLGGDYTLRVYGKQLLNEFTDNRYGVLLVNNTLDVDKYKQAVKRLLEKLVALGISTEGLEDYLLDYISTKYYMTPYGNPDTDIMADVNNYEYVDLSPSPQKKTFFFCRKSLGFNSTQRQHNSNHITFEIVSPTKFQILQNNTVIQTVTVPSFTFEYCIDTNVLTHEIAMTLTSKIFKNNNLCLTDGTPKSRKDYGFQEDLDKYLKDKTVREYIEAFCEIKGGFGKFERDGSFAIDYLAKADHLQPTKGLKPTSGLHPHRATFDMRVAKSMYSRCWYDDELTKPYSKVIATFKNSDNEDEVAEYIIVEDAGNDYQTYDISDNFYIQNNVFSQETIAPILETIGEKIKGVRYMPFDIEMVGMPQLEAGDSVWIKTQEGCFDSYVLRRTLKGIQALKDSITSD